jgi:hypothetical protein
MCANNSFTMTLFNRGVYDVKKVFGFLKTLCTFIYDERNKEFSHMSALFVKKCWPSTRIAHSELWPIKGPQVWKYANVEEQKEDDDCNSSFGKYNLFYVLLLVLQTDWRLGWLFVVVYRSHTVRHRHASLYCRLWISERCYATVSINWLQIESSIEFLSNIHKETTVTILFT